MKIIWLLWVLSVSIFAVNAQVAEKEVKLIGVTSGLEKEVAIIQVRVSRKSPEDMFLKAGQEMNGVEVLKIEPAEGTVNVTVDGEARTLALEADKDHPLTNTIDKTSSVIHFRSIPLSIAISLYADYKNRTVMLHPRLGAPNFSLDVSPGSKDEAAAIFEKMFNEQNIATIPDGEHFVIVAPFAFTNTVKPRSDTLAQTNSIIIPTLSVNFRNAPLPLVLSAYGDYVNEEIVNLNDGGLFPCCDGVTFVQTTPLSKAELCYALETQIEWRNVRVVPDGNGKFKLERIPESK